MSQMTNWSIMGEGCLEATTSETLTLLVPQLLRLGTVISHPLKMLAYSTKFSARFFDNSSV